MLWPLTKNSTCVIAAGELLAVAKMVMSEPSVNRELFVGYVTATNGGVLVELTRKTLIGEVLEIPSISVATAVMG